MLLQKSPGKGMRERAEIRGVKRLSAVTPTRTAVSRRRETVLQLNAGAGNAYVANYHYRASCLAPAVARALERGQAVEGAFGEGNWDEPSG